MEAAFPSRHDPLDLKEGCVREPVHVPGSIQPHGVLLVIDPDTEVIVQRAGDVAALLGFFGEVLGHSVEEAVGQSLAALRAASGAALQREPTHVGTLGGAGEGGSLTLTAHLVNDVVVLELEPAAEPVTAAVVLASISSVTERIGDALNLLEAVNIAAKEVHRISGYDHIMVYQFLADGSGSVIAEIKGPGVSPFLNHRFPASDVPTQARELYRRSPIRVISDVEYAAAPLVPLLLPAINSPLDMSHCALRSVSPVHIKYLKNMGVRASMSVSLLVRSELWGLIACHSRTPMQVPYEARQLCKHVAQIVSQKIRALSEGDDHLLSRDLGSAAERLLRQLHDSDKPDKALLDGCSALHELVHSSGAAIAWQGGVVTTGCVPAPPERDALAAWLRVRLAGGEVFHSEKLSEQYAEAAQFEREGSGLLALLLPGDDAPLLMWFRPEQVEEISWAGNPGEPLDPSSRLGMLNPRRSFATWRETVRGRSEPWRTVEIDAVWSFGRRLAPVLQQQRVRELNTLLQRANEQLASLAATDALTGLANRRAFDERIEYEWARARRHGASLALITLDLDFFKQYNDTFGHPAGDTCLRRVSEVVGQGRRSTDLFARIGGEEFAVLLPDTDLAGALVIADRIRSGVEALKLDHPKSPFEVVTATLGLAVQVPGATSEVHELVKAADAALYAAKAAGRNQIAVA